ncbi:MAG: BON domain-containing protein [Acidobacteriaceae bacterium]
MRRRMVSLLSITAVGVVMLGSPVMFGQSTRSAQMEAQEGSSQVVQQVRKKILNLVDYDVFDWITFQVRGHTLVLEGYASRPILKDEVGRVVKGIAGIESVDNQIKVLPLSDIDNRIRVAEYDKIYRNPALSRYNGNLGGYRSFGGPMLDAVINNPPIGYHAIHIIVDNGHVTLYGIVDSKGDATIAKIQANTVSGVFSVNNELIVGGSKAS